MALIALNERQKNLLRRLVDYVKRERLDEPFAPIPYGNPTRFVLLIQGEESFVFRHISDLDTLCDAGYVGYHWSRSGMGRLYYVTEAGHTAVTTNFAALPKPDPTGINLVYLMQIMSGGTVEAQALDAKADVVDVANDPVQRLEHVNHLVDRLARLVLPALPPADRVIYDNDLRNFSEELCRPRPKSQRLHQYLRTLAFLGQVRGSLDLTTQAWIYLYPLLLIAAARAETATPAMLKKRP